MFKYSSFSRGYHVYKDVWILIIRNDLLTCEREHNDNNRVAIIWDDCVSKKIVRHVPLNLNQVASRFPQFTNYQG